MFRRGCSHAQCTLSYFKKFVCTKVSTDGVVMLLDKLVECKIQGKCMTYRCIVL